MYNSWIPSCKCIIIFSSKQQRTDLDRSTSNINLIAPQTVYCFSKMFPLVGFGQHLCYFWFTFNQTLQTLTHILKNKGRRADVPWWRHFSCRHPWHSTLYSIFLPRSRYPAWQPPSDELTSQRHLCMSYNDNSPGIQFHLWKSFLYNGGVSIVGTVDDNESFSL